MKVYTKGGDAGRTSLVGGARVEKSDPRLEAYGTLDELLANLGFFHDSFLVDTPHSQDMQWIGSRVMDAAAVLATPDGVEVCCPISTAAVERLEMAIDTMSEGLPELRNFTLPLGCAAMSYANVCRTVCRRAERAIIRAEVSGQAALGVQVFVNRLSDYLYVLGRRLAFDGGAGDILWLAGL